MQKATVVVDDDEDFAISFWHNESGSTGNRHGTGSLNAKLQLSLKILGLNFEMHKKFNEHFNMNFLYIWPY